MAINHLAIILDGNRRFAKNLMMQPWKGHEWGAQKVEKLAYWCEELGIKEVTLYALSIQNLNRPKKEFDYLMNLFKKEFDDMIADEKIKKDLTERGLKINVIGRIELLPKDVQERIKTITELTKNKKKHVLNVAMAYGGREEIIDAIKKLGRQIEKGEIQTSQINEKLFADYLYMKNEPDLIIRTGGDHRTSNFLAWQGIYSEWVFLAKKWPEFEKEDLINCIKNYEQRERRYGK